MAPAATAPGMRADARYRTVDEARIIEQLLVFGFAFEIRDGRRAQATQDAAAALQRWIDGGLAWRPAADGGRLFDPGEVMNFMRGAGHWRGDAFWASRLVATSRKHMLSWHANKPSLTSPPSPAALAPRRFAVKFRRLFDFSSSSVRAAGARPLLRLPLPLEDAALSDLRVIPVSPQDRDVDFKLQPGRLDARIDATSLPIELGFDATFTAAPTVRRAGTQVLAATEVALYTAQKEGVIAVTPRVTSLADALCAGSSDAETSVRAFWNHLIASLNCGVLNYADLRGVNAMDWAMEGQWIDCQVASALLVSLCRARRIPARLVSGYLLYSHNTSLHYWSEVWLGDAGWLPMDFMASDLSRRGRDAEWRDCLFGQLDYRMKTECRPRLFNANPAMPFPDRWHMLSRADGPATEIAFHASDTGALFYRDALTAQSSAAA